MDLASLRVRRRDFLVSALQVAILIGSASNLANWSFMVKGRSLQILVVLPPVVRILQGQRSYYCVCLLHLVLWPMVKVTKLHVGAIVMCLTPLLTLYLLYLLTVTSYTKLLPFPGDTFRIGCQCRLRNFQFLQRSRLPRNLVKISHGMVG